MCAIIGCIPSGEINLDWLRHRGPDGACVVKLPKLTLGQTRLAILELSERAAQPKWSANNRALLAYNGEIYNYRSLGARSETSDTAALVEWLAKEGPQFHPGHLDGMYAFAAYFPQEDILTLVRDPAGIKPLYIAFNADGSQLGFASEIKGFFGLEWFASKPNPDMAVQREFLQYGYAFPKIQIVRFRGTEFSIPLLPTLLAGVFQLCPGQKISISLSGGLHSALFTAQASAQAPLVALEETVQEQSMSDVQVGVQLSGGIDSSLVAWQYALRNPEVHGFYVSVPGDELNEDRWAHLAAERLSRLTHFVFHQVNLTQENVRRVLPSVVWGMDEPAMRHPNALGVYLLGEQVRRETAVKVLLTGEGADEMFAGYSWHNGRTLEAYDQSRWIFDLGRYEPAERLLSRFADKTVLERQLAFDRELYLPPILARQDRMSMAWSLETRVPFLANRFLVQAAPVVPGKRVLKRKAAEIFGAEFADRVKCGFGFPGEWLAEFEPPAGSLDWLQISVQPRTAFQRWALAALGFWAETYLHGGWRARTPMLQTKTGSPTILRDDSQRLPVSSSTAGHKESRPCLSAEEQHHSSRPIQPQQAQSLSLGRIFLHADALYSPDQWYRRFQELFERHHLPFVLTDLLAPDRLRVLAQAREGDALIGRFGHIPKDLALIRPIYDQAWRVFRGRVFPNREQYLYYDDKQRQAELFRQKGYPAPKTAWVKDRDELESFMRQHGLGFPVVVKRAEGAGSSNVRLASKVDEAPFPCLVQEYCEGNDRDWRINVIGERVMGFERLVRDQDFRASGSGRIVYPDEFDPELVQLAYRITRENGFGSMAYDFIKRAGQWVVVEMSYAYTDTAVRNCQFYYDMRTGAKTDKVGVYPEDFILSDFLEGHYGIRIGSNPSRAPVASPQPPQSTTSALPVEGQTRRSPSAALHVRPRLMLMADVPNWIFARHCAMLERLLSDQFQVTTKIKGDTYREDDYDLVYPLEWNLIPHAQIRTPAKYVTGIRSHLSWNTLDFPPFIDLLRNHFQSVHVVSKRLHRMFKPFLPDLWHVTHGVDTEYFTPGSPVGPSGRGRLRIGWAGNRKSASKGFEQYIAPLAGLAGVELVFCGYQDQHLDLEGMRRFYHSIDAYVASPLYEGNNNSLMEAAAMRRAIITTDSGAVPEYLSHGESALIVERELPCFIEAVLQLRDDPELRVRLGAAARESVCAKFDWKEMAKCYTAFFTQALERREAWAPSRCTLLEPEPPAPSPRPGHPVIFNAGAAHIENQAQPLSQAAGSQSMELMLASAQASIAKGDWAKARSWLQAALALAPNDPAILEGLGDVDFLTGEFETALQHFQKASTLAQSAGTWLKLAHAAHRLNRIEQFEQAMAQALALEPNHRDALKFLGDLDMQNGLHAEAVEIYNRILRQSPRDVEVLLAVGVCYYKTGQLDSAQAAYELILLIEPAHKLAAENISLIKDRRTAPVNGNKTGGATASQARDSRYSNDASNHALNPAHSRSAGVSESVLLPAPIKEQDFKARQPMARNNHEAYSIPEDSALAPAHVQKPAVKFLPQGDLANVGGYLKAAYAELSRAQGAVDSTRQALDQIERALTSVSQRVQIVPAPLECETVRSQPQETPIISPRAHR